VEGNTKRGAFFNPYVYSNNNLEKWSRFNPALGGEGEFSPTARGLAKPTSRTLDLVQVGKRV